MNFELLVPKQICGYNYLMFMMALKRDCASRLFKFFLLAPFSSNVTGACRRMARRILHETAVEGLILPTEVGGEGMSLSTPVFRRKTYECFALSGGRRIIILIMKGDPESCNKLQPSSSHCSKVEDISFPPPNL